jgi:diadenosine tetraphosphate (Ap4A) HIT family hydrolase
MNPENTSVGDCLFCNMLRTHERPLICANTFFFAVADKYPVSPGHSLIIPKRHITNLLDLSSDEMIALHGILRLVKQSLGEDCNPDGYNIGINEGEAAGQTVPHLHIHIIPRYVGDIDEPRGGIRNIKKALVAY